MPTILVVDDSSVDRTLVGGLLGSQKGLKIEYAAHGAQALEMMERSPPDLVLTDLMMPEIDGLALVSHVRAKYPAVPTILMTSKGSEEIAVQALRQGASGYVPKRTLSEDLVETVSTVLSISVHRRNYSRPLRCMAKIRHAVVLENDLDLINVLVDYLQDGIAELELGDATERMRIGVALREALLNALYHGNLEMDSDARQMGMDAYHRMAKDRARLAPYAERRIFVETEFSRDGVRLEVRDEGSGFDPDSLPDPTDPANLEKLGGRGLVLMRTFMDRVDFNDVGNVVTLSKACKSPA